MVSLDTFITKLPTHITKSGGPTVSSGSKLMAVLDGQPKQRLHASLSGPENDQEESGFPELN